MDNRRMGREERKIVGWKEGDKYRRMNGLMEEKEWWMDRRRER